MNDKQLATSLLSWSTALEDHVAEPARTIIAELMIGAAERLTALPASEDAPGNTVTLPVELVWDRERTGKRSLEFTFADTLITASDDDDNEIGELVATFGGAIRVCVKMPDGDVIWRLSSRDMFAAIHEMHTALGPDGIAATEID